MPTLMTLTDDSQALQALDVDLLFTPTPDIIYPKGLAKQTWVEVPELSNLYCGDSRPGHFQGVTTIVNKLFNLVQPDVACFGEKDFQQLALIKIMVEDLSIPVTVIGVPTVREKSGLAKSSRNGYLSAKEKQQAAVIYQTLTQLKTELEQGNKNFEQLSEQAQQKVKAAGLMPDYLRVLNRDTLQAATQHTRAFVIIAAAYLGKTRLIDNIQVELN